MKIISYHLIIFLLFISLPGRALVTTWSTSLPEQSQFKISKDLRPRVEFWKKIYSEVSVYEGLFHNVDQPQIIYGRIDLRPILNHFLYSEKLKKKLLKNKIENERSRLAKKYGLKDVAQVRLQMGLKERMQKALFLSGKYLPMMENIFEQQQLPVELTRLVFVESSFNIFAQSKVGASGLWQIMPSVAKAEGYIKPDYDYRNHPIYSTVLAAEILKNNYRQLKSWPLAVTAYNHGLTGVKRMVKKSESKDIVDLIDSENPTRTWGFASQNFYACFLAVISVEREAQSLFGEQLIKSKPQVSYLVKTIRPASKKEILKFYNGSYAQFKSYNPHLNYRKIATNHLIKKGTPIVLPKLVDKQNLFTKYDSNLLNRFSSQDGATFLKF